MVLLLLSKNSFSYIPKNEREKDILGWNTSKGEPEQIIFIDRKVRIIGDAKLTRVDTSGNQEPQKTRIPDDIEVNTDIEVTPTGAI